jgi:hypothetical protein
MQRETRRAQPPVEGVEVGTADDRRRAEPDGELVGKGSLDGLQGDWTTLRFPQVRELAMHTVGEAQERRPVRVPRHC